MEISFRQMRDNDLEMFQRWLHVPHVLSWWREPFSLDEVRAEYLDRINGVDLTEPWIVEVDREPAGYVQRYWIGDWPEWEAALRHVEFDPKKAKGIDYFIGESDLIDRGVGTKMIHAFVIDTFSDPNVSCIVSDPLVANIGSCRVLEKNGFVSMWQGQLESEHPADDGVSAIYLLTREAFNAQHTH